MNKDNIRKIKKAIVFESEKAVLQYDSYFGPESNISVACCGSNLITYQLELLLSLKVNRQTLLSKPLNISGFNPSAL